jgi:hypothetical protein
MKKVIIDGIEYVPKQQKEEQQQEKTIYVPDNIQFEYNSEEGDELGLIFFDDCVFYTRCSKPRITASCQSNFVKTKLEPVDKPVAGNWYCASDDDNPDFSNHMMYERWVSDKEYYFVLENKSILLEDVKFKHYWRVVRVDDK